MKEIIEVHSEPHNDLTFASLRQFVTHCMKRDVPDDALVRVDVRFSFETPAPVKRLCVVIAEEG